MNAPASDLLFDEDDSWREEDIVTCVWCEAVLVAHTSPDERTIALWLRGSFRECGDRYSLNATADEFRYARDGRCDGL